MPELERQVLHVTSRGELPGDQGDQVADVLGVEDLDEGAADQGGGPVPEDAPRGRAHVAHDPARVEEEDHVERARHHRPEVRLGGLQGLLRLLAAGDVEEGRGDGRLSPPGSHGHERLDPEHLAVAPHGLELVAGRRGIAAKPRRRVALKAESLVRWQPVPEITPDDVVPPGVAGETRGGGVGKANHEVLVDADALDRLLDEDGVERRVGGWRGGCARAHGFRPLELVEPLPEAPDLVRGAIVGHGRTSTLRGGMLTAVPPDRHLQATTHPVQSGA